MGTGCTLTDDVYVINLDRAESRMRDVQKNLSRYGVDFERVRAVDGARLSLRQIRRTTSIFSRTIGCSRSTIGCALSHLKAWIRICRKFPNALENRWHMILEDDAFFLPNTTTALKYIEGQYLGSQPWHECDARIVHMAPNAPFLSDSEKSIDIDAVEIKRPIVLFSTCAYILTTSMARKLSRDLRRVYYHLDVVIFNVYKRNVWTTRVDLVGNAGMSPEKSFNVGTTSALPLMERSLVDIPVVRFVMRTTVACIATKVDISIGRLMWLMMAVMAIVVKRIRIGVSAYLISETCLSAMLNASA